MIESLGLVEVPPDPPQPPLEAGVRAGLGTVGYLGSMGALRTLTPDDTPPTGTVWDTGALIVGQAGVVLDRLHIMGAVFVDGHDGCVISNCVVEAPVGGAFAVHLNGIDAGVLTVTDTTVIGHPDLSTLAVQTAGISSDAGLIARRCDVSGTGDGVHFAASNGNTLISQCCIHDLSFVGEDQHCDGMQAFAGQNTGDSFTVEHCYVAPILSTIGTPANSAATCGQPPSGNVPEIPLSTAIFTNNYLGNGVYHLRVGYRMTDCVITGNDFGPLAGNEVGLFDTPVSSQIATWSNNHDSNGVLIPQP